MRKTFIVCISFILLLSIAGCNSGNNDGSSPVGNEGGQENKKEGKTVIVVSSLTDDGWIAQVKRKYEDLHPDIEIQIKSYMSSEGVITSDDFNKFIMVMNTELLSGKGPDIIDVGITSTEEWINKNLLANLSELMAEDSTFDQSQLFEQILEVMKLNGSLYVMPVSFMISSMLVGDADAIQASGVQIDDSSWTWDDFVQIAEKLMEDKKYNYAFGGYSPESLLIRQIRSNYRMWVDAANRQAHFQSDAFITLLQQTKALYDKKVVTADLKGGGEPEMYFYPANIFSMENYLSTKSIFNNTKLYSMPGSGEKGAGIAFLAAEALAINEKSAVKQEAWEFIKFLVSEEMQYSPEFSPEYFSFMINKNAFEKWMKDIQELETIELMDGSTVEVTEEDIQELGRLIARANTIIIDDDTVFTIITEEAEAYFSGQKSAEDVAKLIQNRVMTYINE